MKQTNLTENQKKIYDDLDFLVSNWNHRLPSGYQTIITDYIKKAFMNAGARVSEQAFNILNVPETKDNIEFKNVIASFGPEEGSRIIVGAHYDVYNNPGADDNGSGIVGLIELARRLGINPPKKRIDIVAFANEEPPFFATSGMGSFQHAESLKKSNIKVDEMICFEMIGVSYEEKDTQDFPPGLENLGQVLNKGNFVAVCGRTEDTILVRKILKSMNALKQGFGLPIAPPRFMAPWLDMSDQMNYWDRGIRAVIVTDTAFLRHKPGKNSTYHTMQDTIEKINFAYLERIVEGVTNYLLSE